MAGHGAAHAEPEGAVEAVAALNRNGIPSGILIAPLMPGINDAPEQVEEILELAAEAGATGIGGIDAAPARRGEGSSSSWLHGTGRTWSALRAASTRMGAYLPADGAPLLELRRRRAGRGRPGATAAGAAPGGGRAGAAATRYSGSAQAGAVLARHCDGGAQASVTRGRAGCRLL